MRRRSRQLELGYRTHGGARAGAGRKPVGERAGQPHVARPAVVGRFPLHLTMRIVRGMPSLRAQRLIAVVRAALSAGRRRERFRLVHWAVQPDHLHLVVEAGDARALTAAARGLAVRIARRLNGALRRGGKVFAERYHARALKTPREVRRALAYVLLQERRHAAKRRSRPSSAIDLCSSAPCFDGFVQTSARWGPDGIDPAVGEALASVTPARTWLLSTGWRRHGLVDRFEVPGATTR